MALGQSLPFQARQLLYEHLHLVQLELATSREALRVIEIDDDATGEQGNHARNGHGDSGAEPLRDRTAERSAHLADLGEQAHVVRTLAAPLSRPNRLEVPFAGSERPSKGIVREALAAAPWRANTPPARRSGRSWGDGRSPGRPASAAARWPPV